MVAFLVFVILVLIIGLYSMGSLVIFVFNKSSITQVNIHVSLVCNKKIYIKNVYFDSPSVGEAAAAAVLDKSDCVNLCLLIKRGMVDSHCSSFCIKITQRGMLPLGLRGLIHTLDMAAVLPPSV